MSASDFLVQRLVADSRCRQKPSETSDGDDRASDSSSDGGAPEPPRACPQPAAVNPLQFAAAAGLLPNPFHYATALAHLASLNLVQPSAANQMPFFYPHLFNSFLSMPNVDTARLGTQSPAKGAPSKPSTPDTAKASTTASPSPRKRCGAPRPAAKQGAAEEAALDGDTAAKRARATKRLQFDDDVTQSPVSGMFIREADAVPPPAELQAAADAELDESARWVEVSDEAREQLARIDNLIGDYVCRLCKVKYEDAFKLAQHRCPRIVHEEYRCPECDKVFSCPANLASHRRWHKPKTEQSSANSDLSSPEQTEPLNLILSDQPTECERTKGVECWRCGKSFADKDKLKEHETAAHGYFQCKYCPLTFTTSPALTRHINKHHPTDQCRVVLLQPQIGAADEH